MPAAAGRDGRRRSRRRQQEEADGGADTEPAERETGRQRDHGRRDHLVPERDTAGHGDPPLVAGQ